MIDPRVPEVANGPPLIQPPAATGASLVLDSPRRAWLVAGLCVLYVALDWLTYVFPARFGVTPFNPEAAVAVAMLMFFGLRYMPFLFAAILWGEVALPAASRPLAVVLINSTLLLMAFAVMAILLTRPFRVRVELDTRQDVLRLMGVTLATMLICGVVYVGVLVLFGIGASDRYFNGARRFFIGYSVGVLVAGPLLLMLFGKPRREQFAAYLRSPESWMQAVTVAACVWWLFFLQDPKDHIRNFYLLFLPLIWGATRFGMVGASGVLVLIQAGVLIALVLTRYQPVPAFELQLLLIALAVTGLLLGVSIDEQRRAVEDFRDSLKLAAAGEMAAAITHEVNQPLTALANYADAVQMIAAAPQLDRGRLSDTVRKLTDESKRTAAVVRRLRDFFRSGATQLETVSIKRLADQVLDSVRPRALQANVALVCRAADTLPLVQADVLQMEVVLRNVLINAIDSITQAAVSGKSAGTAGGSVTVEIGMERAGSVLVAVRDSGPGFREGDVERLFESFTTTKKSGMGMGLTISREIVKAHGGRIWAVPGNTGLLCFTLPVSAPLDEGVSA